MRALKEPAMKNLAILILVVSAAFFFLRAVPYAPRPTAGFMAGYFGGRMLLTHQPMSRLYDTTFFGEFSRTGSGLPFGEIYTANTPVFPFVFLPFALLPLGDAKLSWELFSFVCLLAALALLYRHLRLDSLERIVITALVFAFTPLYMNFVWGQFYVLLLLLHVALLYFWSNGKLLAASASIALLLSLKGYGVFFLVVALLRKEWLLLGYAIALYALIVGLSGLVVGYDTWLAYVGQAAHHLSAMPASATFQQTIGSFFSWFLARDEWHPHPWFDLPFLVRPLITLSLAAGLWLLVRICRIRSGLEEPFAAAIIMSVLTAPLLFDYHYVLLLIPILICYKYVSGLPAGPASVAFGMALFLLVPKIPYYDSAFQNSWLGIFGFPRVYGALILIWIFHNMVGGGIARRVISESKW
jgi:glycosyl transferase family 87